MIKTDQHLCLDTSFECYTYKKNNKAALKKSDSLIVYDYSIWICSLFLRDAIQIFIASQEQVVANHYRRCLKGIIQRVF